MTGRVPARPRPRRHTITLLVGRVTTIKLAYWALLTAAELALPRFDPRPVAERLPVSYAIAAVASALAVTWAVWSARTIDRLAGGLYRSVPLVATTFVAASVVATPGSLPLLLLERQRSLEDCAPGITCHFAPLVLWIAVIAIGTVAIPAAFAIAMRGDADLDPRP